MEDSHTSSQGIKHLGMHPWLQLSLSPLRIFEEPLSKTPDNKWPMQFPTHVRAFWSSHQSGMCVEAKHAWHWHITLGCTLHPYCQTICKRNVLRTHTSESKVTSHLISPRWKKKPAAWLKDGVAATGLPLLPQLPVLKFLPFLQGARDTWELHNSTYLQPSHSAPKTPAISTLRIREAMRQRHQCYTCRTAENRRVHEDTHPCGLMEKSNSRFWCCNSQLSKWLYRVCSAYNEVCKSSRHLLPSFSYNKSNKQLNNLPVWFPQSALSCKKQTAPVVPCRAKFQQHLEGPGYTQQLGRSLPPHDRNCDIDDSNHSHYHSLLDGTISTSFGDDILIDSPEKNF